MENNKQTWECPNCHEAGNTANFCSKCGAKKPEPQVDKEALKAQKKEKSRKTIETITAVAMIIFFSLSLIFVLSSQMSVYKNSNTISIDFYYFFYTVWANLKESSSTIEVIRAVVSTLAFLAGVVAVYYFGIKGLIDSIKVVKTRKEPEYAIPLMGVIGAMFGYYTIVSVMYKFDVSGSNTPYTDTSAGAGIVLFIMSLVLVLIALMARSFVFAIIDKKPLKVAATIVKFVSIIFVIAAIPTIANMGIKYVSRYDREITSLFNWSAIFFEYSKNPNAEGYVGPGVLMLFATLFGLASSASSILCLCSSYGSLINEKKSKIACVYACSSTILLLVTLVLTTILFFIIPSSSYDSIVPENIPAAIILSLLGIIGLVVSSALEKDKAEN